MKIKFVLPIIFCLCTGPVFSAEYKIDPAHSFLTFRIQHLGFSWLIGQFRNFEGYFFYDAGNPEKSSVRVVVESKSLDTNYPERDRHIRSADFLEVETYPEAIFESTAYTGNGSYGVLSGNLTLHGVTKVIEIRVSKIGEGEDPWGGYRAGFQGTFSLNQSEFGIDFNLGSSSKFVYFQVDIEGVRKR